MKVSSFLLVFQFLFQISVESQRSTRLQKFKKYDSMFRTEEQTRADSLDFEKFEKEEPALFENRRLATRLMNGSSIIDGYSTNIEIYHNYILDSLDHNFNPSMPDTSTGIPFSQVRVTEAKINVILFSHLILGHYNSNTEAYVTPFPTSLVTNNMVENMPLGDFNNDFEIRESINGRIIFNWKKIKDFAHQPYKAGVIHKGVDEFMYGYSYGYAICDTIINTNDQVLIEIKRSRGNLMVDRYNITRDGVRPFLAKLIIGFGEEKGERTIRYDSQQIQKGRSLAGKALDSIYYGFKGNGIMMGNDYDLPQQNVLFVFRKPTPDFNDSLQYKLLSKGHTDTAWHTTWNMIYFSPANPGNYELIARYKNGDANIASYRWTVKSKWYQTTAILIVAMILIILLLFLVGFFIHKSRLRNETERRNKLAMELRSIQSQLNPHFIFNSLSSIQGLINTNKIDEANEYLTDFSRLLRNTLNEAGKVFQSLENEIKMLETYLKLEQLRFRFTYSINLGANLDANELEIPALLLQPLLENAIKHGVSECREQGSIAINFSRNNHDMIAEIRDNGKGFPPSVQDGYGWKLTNDKIMLLGKMLKSQSIEKTIFRENNQTCVQLIFKNWIS